MAMKTYGIFLAYAPHTEMRVQGLGRYLALFLKAGTALPDTRFVVAAPSWLREELTKLFADADIPASTVELVGPTVVPLSVRYLSNRRRRKVRSFKFRLRIRKAVRYFKNALTAHIRNVMLRLAASRSRVVVFALALYLCALAILGLPFILLFGLAVGLKLLFSQGRSSVSLTTVRRFLAARRGRSNSASRLVRGKRWLVAKMRTLAVDTGERLKQNEISDIVRLANKCDVIAWYCPTPFWPEINGLARPQLVCVPDVVLAEFPVGFATIGDELTFNSFKKIETILGMSKTFVTYSKQIKESILVDRFNVPSDSVHVVSHAPIDLSRHLLTNRAKLEDRSTAIHSRDLLARAIGRSGQSYFSYFRDVGFSYIIYPTQFRPSKNILTLLRAYNYLLKERYFGRKLFLTGVGDDAPEVVEYINSNGLQFEVIIAHNLPEAQLAGCYHAADLAVNTSLSEGGMPFTFTESLSSGTPVVMSDIAVTREVLTDVSLREATVFDPYDWRSVADKIEWALENREWLYRLQRKFYEERLCGRGWPEVVGEHIAILDQIGAR